MKSQKQRAVLKLVLYNKNIDLYIDMIRGLNLDKKTVILHPHEYYKDICDEPTNPLIKYGMQVTIYDADIFNKVKFEYIKHIKTLPNPEERVASFEWRDENGLPDWPRFERLVESRKTREEKRKEFDEELEIKKACHRLGIEYNGPLGRVS